MPKVLIVGRDFLIHKMFQERGWEVVSKTGEDPDLVQFTGGEDVSPSLYGELPHPATYSNPARDMLESVEFLRYMDTPKAGICRGGQFLNVMSGGSMWQHVDNHTQTHYAVGSNIPVTEVTSTHHQMMRPSELAKVLLVSFPALSTYKQSAESTTLDDGEDVEVVFYEHTSSLCFQPHPEYVKDDHPCRDLYFNLLEEYLNLKA